MHVEHIQVNTGKTVNADIPWKFDVLNFLEFGISTAGSDHFGLIVLTETGPEDRRTRCL